VSDASPNTAVDVDMLGRAGERLDEALASYAAHPSDLHLRDSVIMRFLFCYELSVKSLERYLEATSASPEITQGSFQTMIRRADDRGLVRTGWPGWERYRIARNQVAHTYNEERARKVADTAADFAEEVRFLRDVLGRSSLR
jgi:nucleotidyltransferase substrate binding protein (TIGR01987 family)